jgi:hypothetical protein
MAVYSLGKDLLRIDYGLMKVEILLKRAEGAEGLKGGRAEEAERRKRRKVRNVN